MYCSDFLNHYAAERFTHARSSSSQCRWRQAAGSPGRRAGFWVPGSRWIPPCARGHRLPSLVPSATSSPLPPPARAGWLITWPLLHTCRHRLRRTSPSVSGRLMAHLPEAAGHLLPSTSTAPGVLLAGSSLCFGQTRVHHPGACFAPLPAGQLYLPRYGIDPFWRLCMTAGCSSLLPKAVSLPQQRAVWLRRRGRFCAWMKKLPDRLYRQISGSIGPHPGIPPPRATPHCSKTSERVSVYSCITMQNSQAPTIDIELTPQHPISQELPGEASLGTTSWPGP